MAAMIVCEISHDDGVNWAPHGAYAAFDAFFDDVMRFQESSDPGLQLRVHVPGSFGLTSEQVALIDGLGITRL